MSTQEIEKDWVVMIYMAAANDLGNESVWALTEIKDVVLKGQEANTQIGVAVLFDSGMREVPTQVFKFGLGAEAPDFTSAILTAAELKASLTTTSEGAAEPSLLTEFVRDTINDHPAKHYMLILSGHGSGAVGDFLKGGPNFTGMSIPELSSAIAEATGFVKKDIDVLGMDSCLMSMVEVCYQLPSSVKFLVGSEGYDPTTGWPYQRLLQTLSATPQVTPQRAAALVAEAYVEYYADYIIAGTSVDIACCDLSEGNKKTLAAALKGLAQNLQPRLTKRPVRDAVILAHWEAQAYKRETYTDLWDFCHLLQARFEEEDPLHQHCKEVKTAIETMVQASYYGPEFQHSHGLSVYFPWREFQSELKEYTSLSFAGEEQTDWGSFLETYLKVTRREKRGEPRSEKEQTPEEREAFLAEAGIEEILLTPPLGAGGIVFQVHKAGNPPDKAGNPPDKAGNPPDKMGVFTRSASMKNPPNGFLVKKKNRKKAIL